MIPRLLLLFTAGLAFAGPNQTFYFRRTVEPRERAFTVLVPRGWTTEGGIFRMNPNTSGGTMNAIGAKCDYSIKRDAGGSVMVRWLPEMAYIDTSRMPVAGIFRPGSNYNGATVSPVLNPQAFLAQVVFRKAHPQARNVQIIERKAVPATAQRYSQMSRVLAPGIPFRYEAGMLAVRYQEGNTLYEERLFAVIEDWSATGTAIWGNKETFFIRAPAAEFAAWAPVLAIVQGSVEINGQWLAGELKGQIERSNIAARTQREIARIDAEIADHRRRTNAEINHDMFLTLNNQEEYVNPYTNKVETGSNDWKYRWVNPSGEVVYSNDTSYDPNHDVQINRSDFKRTPVRPRRP